MAGYSAKSLKGTSGVVLDILRLLCSLLVLVVHSRAIWFPEHQGDLLTTHLSHGAVVIFFVLSGYVIAHTTSSGHRSARDYVIARLTRLCSVYFPAIAVTIVCALAAYIINPSVYAGYNRGDNIVRYLISLAYCNEIWFLSAAPLINQPLWSLGYEFWYYALFGVFFYRFEGWKGLLLPLAVALFVGPKILLMMMIWVMGWAAYHIRKPVLNAALSWIVVSLLLILSLVLMVELSGMPYPVLHPPLFWAAAFFTDWIVGFFVALAIWLFPTDVERPLQDTRLLRKMRSIANLTFPIYVLHYPLLILMKCILPAILSTAMLSALDGLLTLWICVCLGLLFDAYKSKWKDYFTRLVGRVTGFFLFQKLYYRK